MKELRDKRLFLLDMDGTIYIDNDIFDGTLDFLRTVREKGGRFAFLTNNSSKGTDAYIEKLGKMGIKAEKDDFVTSVDATAIFLKKSYGDKRIYVSGTRSFVSQLRDFGLNVTEELEDDISCFVMGYDTELTYAKLERACILLMRGVDYIATNPDMVCPTAYGSAPDCGSVADMLCNATGRRPRFIGKPEPDMVYLALAKYGYGKEDAVLIGDRLYTDIRCAVNAGIDSIMVLSGECTRDDLERYDFAPTYVLEDIAEVLENIRL